jgi:hypothetical protein
MNSDIPEGGRFSHVYVSRGEPTDDSTRMRRRLASLVEEFTGLDGLGSRLKKELGVRLPYDVAGLDWDEFFAKCELRDLLDTVTIAWQYLNVRVRTERYAPSSAAPESWLQQVRRIFEEENVRYRIDSKGGVHFAIDDEFERNRAASLAVLNGPRYSNVLNEFDAAYSQLAAIPPIGKAAIRSTFSAAEGLFRLMFSEAPRLGAKEIDKYVPALLQRMHANDQTASRASHRLLNSFKEWVDAAHFYRHEPGKEEIAQPPMPLAINLVSLGASYIRWLAEIDAAQQAA